MSSCSHILLLRLQAILLAKFAVTGVPLARLKAVVLEIPLLSWIQEGFKGGFLQKHLNPIRPFLGDSVRILGCISDFWSVTPTFGLYL